MNHFGVVSFVHDVEVRMSESGDIVSGFFQRAGYHGPDAGIS